MEESQREFAHNFENEVNSETGEDWTPLAESTLQSKENPDNGILVDTGSLKNETLRGNIVYTQNSATLIVDPIDKRGRGYASYHMDGDGVPERDYITRSRTLGSNLENIALNHVDKSFT